MKKTDHQTKARHLLRSSAETVAQLARNVVLRDGITKSVLDAAASAAEQVAETARHGGATAGALHAQHIAQLLRVAVDGAGLTMTQRRTIITSAGYMAMGLMATLPTEARHRADRAAAAARSSKHTDDTDTTYRRAS